MYRDTLLGLKGDLMMKLKLFNLLLSSFILVTMVGCASITPTSPGAESVKITRGPISNNCSLKGNVEATNVMSGEYQHSQLVEDEYNRLRNQAAQLGANTVLLIPSSGMADKKHLVGKTTHAETARHVYSGKAYWCPAN